MLRLTATMQRLKERLQFGGVPVDLQATGKVRESEADLAAVEPPQAPCAI